MPDVGSGAAVAGDQLLEEAANMVPVSNTAFAGSPSEARAAELAVPDET